MTKKGDKRDWDSLSAFIDGEISPELESEILVRLDSDKDFRRTYEQIKYTRSIMLALPEIRTPRHFILTEEMVGRNWLREFQSRFSWNLISAIASVMLVLVVIGEVMTFGLPAIGAQESTAEISIVIDAAQEEFAEAAAMPEQMEDREADDSAPQVAEAKANEEADLGVEPLIANESVEGMIEGRIDTNADVLNVGLFRMAEGILGLLTVIGLWRAKTDKRH